MRCPDIIEDEAGRLEALAEYALSADITVPGLQPLVEIAASLFGTGGAAVNMIGSSEVFFVASSGIGTCDMRRDISFCAHAILQDEVMVVEDATVDPRFHDNPLVNDGHIRFYAGVPLRTPSGHALGALCVVDSEPRRGFTPQDRQRLKDLAGIATEKLELRRLEIAEQLWPAFLADSANGAMSALLSFDRNGIVRGWNESARDILGYDAVEVVGQPFARMLPARAQERLSQAIARLVRNETPELFPTDPMLIRARDGQEVPVNPVWARWDTGEDICFGALLQPIRQGPETAGLLHRLANFDSLTGLPNRQLFCETVAATLKDGMDAALILVDIDSFKDVNDTMGHPTGDRMLQVLADRLLRSAGKDAVTARIGGDEFAVLLPGQAGLSASTVAGEIMARLGDAILIDNQEVRVTASCGLAIAPLHGDRGEDLLASADLALFQAKAKGRSNSFLYVPALRAEAIARRMYDAEIHRAVECGEFEVHYQPQVRLSDGALTGAEALIRWRHPVRGLISPVSFMPAVELSALAADVGAWVIDTALEFAREMRERVPEFRMSANLSTAQFGGEDLAERVAAQLARHQLPGHALELEVTENIAIGSEALVLPQLRALRRLDVQLALDDFGTGYASLNLLKNFPINHIKIDKSFTQASLESETDRTIISALVTMARQIGLRVIVEGIENRRQLSLLRSMGCDEGQGFLFGRPVPREIFLVNRHVELLPGVTKL